MEKIILDEIKLFGFHGCSKEEKLVGSYYSIKLEIQSDFEKAFLHDDLSKTIDYSILYKIVEEEMKIRSNLIEHLAKRIIDKIKKINNIKNVQITICKENPPLKNGQIKRFCIMIKK